MLELSKIDEAIRSEGGITRRLLLAYAAALAAIPTLGQRTSAQPKDKVTLKEKPFKLGVASGDPTHDSVVIWTRLCTDPHQANGGVPHKSIDVHWKIGNDENVKDVVQEKTIATTSELGHSVHVDVKGLKPGRWYYYQFRCAGHESPIGRTRTMPAEDARPKELKLAFASCQNYEDGYFTAYQHMAKQDLDLVFHLGDYIYEFGSDKPVRKHHKAGHPNDLPEYRIRHCEYRADEHLHHAHSRFPWVLTWDDHEVEGNYADDISKRTNKPKAVFLKQRAAAYQAYYEMMPIRAHMTPGSHDLKLYRSISFGQLADFQVLDTRQYRSDQLSDGDAPITDAVKSRNRTLLGKDQWTWLRKELGESKATWNVIAQQIVMALLDRHNDKQFSMDAWPGYFNDRKELLELLARKKNAVVLSGDVHSNWVNELRVDDRDAKLPIVASEFVGTSVSSKGDGEPVPDEHLTKLKRVNPCAKYHDNQRGYVRCIVTAGKWQADLLRVEKVSKKDAPVTKSVSFVVEAGKPGVVQG